jgi:hypothetical protein
MFKNVLLSVTPRSISIEVSSFLRCFAISAGKDLPTFRESISKCYPSISYSLPEELSVHSHSCRNKKKTAKDKPHFEETPASVLRVNKNGGRNTPLRCGQKQAISPKFW